VDLVLRRVGRQIRPFAEHDRADVTTLWQEMFADDPPWNAPEPMIRRKLSVQPQLFLVGELEGKVVATVLAGFDVGFITLRSSRRYGAEESQRK
jgi:hypothetical protein